MHRTHCISDIVHTIISRIIRYLLQALIIILYTVLLAWNTMQAKAKGAKKDVWTLMPHLYAIYTHGNEITTILLCVLPPTSPLWRNQIVTLPSGLCGIMVLLVVISNQFHGTFSSTNEILLGRCNLVMIALIAQFRDLKIDFQTWWLLMTIIGKTKRQGWSHTRKTWLQESTMNLGGKII